MEHPTLASARESDASAAGGESPRGAVAPLRVAIAGLGRLGLSFAGVLALRREVELIGFAEPRRDRRGLARGIGFAAPAFPHIVKLLAKTSPELVIVCGAPERRASVARLALDAGSRVFAVFPPAATDLEALTLRPQAQQLACASALAFHPLFARAGRLLDAGALGRIRDVRASLTVSRVFGPRTGAPAGNVIDRFAADLLFVLVRMFGAPVEARATASRLYRESQDEARFDFKLANGVEVGMECSWSVPGYPRPAIVIEASGEQGRLLVSDDAMEAELARPTDGLADGPTRLLPADLASDARFDLGGEEIDVLVESILGWARGAPAPGIDFERALEAQRALEAAQRSIVLGGEPVRITA